MKFLNLNIISLLIMILLLAGLVIFEGPIIWTMRRYYAFDVYEGDMVPMIYAGRLKVELLYIALAALTAGLAVYGIRKQKPYIFAGYLSIILFFLLIGVVFYARFMMPPPVIDYTL